VRRKRTYIDYLRDMLTYAETAESFVGDLEFEVFSRDTEKTFAVVRALEVVGEAARHIPADARNAYPDVPWSKVVGMRDIVIHGYFGVDLEVIWKTVREDLPPLREAAGRMLEEIERRERPAR
jgi:uncharacterized protein with HEPN domain